MSAAVEISSKQIPAWFGQLAVAVALAGGGAWLLGEHARINEIEHRLVSNEIEAGKVRVQLDEIEKTLDKIYKELLDRRRESEFGAQTASRPR